MLLVMPNFPDNNSLGGRLRGARESAGMKQRVKVDEAAGERWFCTEDEAFAAGWTRANR